MAPARESGVAPPQSKGLSPTEKRLHASPVQRQSTPASPTLRTACGKWACGTRHIDEPVCMYKGGYRLYYHQDANYNVLALTDDRGNEVERYQYTPYGRVAVETFSDWADSDGDGDVDLTDYSVFSSAFNGPNRVPGGSPSDYRWDADFDGDVDLTDYNTFSALFNGPNGVVRRSAGRTSSVVGNPLLHQGLYQDAETGLYHNRARTYHPTLGRFMQRDPLGMWPNDRGRADVLKQYTDGVNGYQYVASGPMGRIDPEGMDLIIGIGLPPSVQEGQVRLGRLLRCRCCMKEANKGGALLNDANQRTNAWAKETGNDGEGSCKRDAMQHCIGAALAAGKCGAWCAREAGRHLEDKYPLKEPVGNRDRERDLANNEQGLSCKDAGDVVQCCADKLKKGTQDGGLDVGEDPGGGCH
ncbi:MAG: hypothetical protein JXA69_18140 [Phycisphaerae bacterium]|nr:hypothetical protein [Phycisphaerae bacterium]